MIDRPRSDPGASSALGKLAGFVIAVVVLAGIYVGYQALQVLFPPNTYETALLATVRIRWTPTAFSSSMRSMFPAAERWAISRPTASASRQGLR